ncbi:MAG: ABC transporter permease [Acidobacteria bacterium]|nr:ABC transporter permease [Acidobacteriota bacterium]
MIFQGAKSASVALGETLRLALDALRSHKLRSFLTLLGVILAVTTLVAVMSVVEGLNVYVSDKVANLGANVFVVDRFGIITSWDEWTKAQRRPVVTVEEYEALAADMQQAQQVAAIEGTLSDIRYSSDLIEDVNLLGVTPNYGEVRSMTVSAGRFFNDTDERHRSPVCFIGADVAQRFFPSVDPIGKSVRAGSQTYQVVGVAKAIGSVFGQSQDKFVLIPFGTYLKTRHTQRSSITLFVQARHAELMEAAQDEARMLLRARRHLRWDDPDNFGIVGSASITSLWEKLTRNIFQLAVGLTSVFLVVGGIVIMNIMLASVTERTREIGIRRSLGARRRHIVMQFLVESAVLAAAGGFIGIVLALGIGAVVRATTPMPITTPARAVLTALTLSTGVGLFFGIYPAVRAARLDPIEALRAET